MNIPEHILDYASKQSKSFSRNNLMQFLDSINVSEQSACVSLSRLVSHGELSKVGPGLYAMPQGNKNVFIYHPSDEEKRIANMIKENFPFAGFCIWKTSVLTPYMQHIPSTSITLIDVEKEASESVFFYLQDIGLGTQILLNPNKKECDKYITAGETIIIRNLVKEAPVTTSDGIPVPSIEKILVDTAGDTELNFAQGSELYTIFENAFNEHKINVKRIIRYASRRNRKNIILKIINTLNI